jgi:hypothetical protein
MGTRRYLNKYYNYKRTAKELDHEFAWMAFFFILGGPFTFGLTWLGLFVIWCTEDCSLDAWND